jgi:hypothetical protein
MLSARSTLPSSSCACWGRRTHGRNSAGTRGRRTSTARRGADGRRSSSSSIPGGPSPLRPWPFIFCLLPRFPGSDLSSSRGTAYLGFTVLISPWAAALSCLVWIIVHRIVRIPFIASFFMILTLGGAVVVASGGEAAAIAGTVATVLLIVFNHRKNIVTLLEERRR